MRSCRLCHHLCVTNSFGVFKVCPGHQHPEMVSRRNLRFVRHDLLEHVHLDVAPYVPAKINLLRLKKSDLGRHISCLSCAIAARTARTARTTVCFELRKSYLQIVVVAVVVGQRTAWDGTEDCMGRWTALDKTLHQRIGQHQTTDSMGRRAAQDSRLLWKKDCAKTTDRLGLWDCSRRESDAKQFIGCCVRFGACCVRGLCSHST